MEHYKFLIFAPQILRQRLGTSTTQAYCIVAGFSALYRLLDISRGGMASSSASGLTMFNSRSGVKPVSWNIPVVRFAPGGPYRSIPNGPGSVAVVRRGRVLVRRSSGSARFSSSLLAVGARPYRRIQLPEQHTEQKPPTVNITDLYTLGRNLRGGSNGSMGHFRYFTGTRPETCSPSSASQPSPPDRCRLTAARTGETAGRW